MMGERQKGGLYITTLNNYLYHYGFYGNNARKVIIEPDAMIYIEAPNRLKCDKIFLEDLSQKMNY